MRMRLVGVVVALGLLAGCGFGGAQDLPLPGAAGGGGYEITLVFEDATNLVPKETCRANDTVVGSVVSVELDDDLDAEVVCRIDPDVDLPGNVEATLRETSLLGERYVALDVPAGEEPTGTLEAGAVVPVSETVVHPNTELVLGALSQVLNGGSLGSLATISRELVAALEGRAGDARQGARRLATLLSDLDRNRTHIVSALEALDDLSTTLVRQRGVIADTLELVPAGLAVLDRQRPALVRALHRVSRLSETIVPLVERSRDATVADLNHLDPVLRSLGRAGDELTLTLERLVSFPFNSNTLYTVKGDYAGAYVQANIDLDTVIALITDLLDQTPNPLPDPSRPDEEETPGLPELPLPELPLPELPELPGLDLPELGDLLGLSGFGAKRGVVDQRRPGSLADLLTGPAR